MVIREQVLLAPYTTFHIGGYARYFAEAASDKEIAHAVDFAHTNQLPVFILGGGSNLLISDKGFDGLVIHMTGKNIKWEERDSSTLAIVDAGVKWDDLVGICVERGLWGIENLSGVPGSVGATPVQNIGAYGVEIGTYIEWVRVYDKEINEFKNLSQAECHFDYRDSIFKHKEGESFIVVQVAYNLSHTGQPNINYKDLVEYEKNERKIDTLIDVRNAVLAIRSRKFPSTPNIGTAGSFFKNPIVSKEKGYEFVLRFPAAPIFPQKDGNIKLSAAWIIDRVLGMKGVRDGGVGTWDAQALVMINYGNANALEVSRFAAHIIERGKKEIGITLEPEVVYIGDI